MSRQITLPFPAGNYWPWLVLLFKLISFFPKLKLPSRTNVEKSCPDVAKAYCKSRGFTKMSGKLHHYESWKESTISEVKVQYYLRSCLGISLLAAEGNKNSEGHIIYEVAKDYLEAFGSKATINAYTQWTKRGDVVKWLDSLVRRDDSPPNKLDDGLSMDVEEDVLPHAEVSHLATRYVVIALPAPSQAHLYENRTRRGRKRKCLDLVPKHQGDGSSIDEKGKLAQEDSVKEFPRKLRSSLLHQKQDSGRLDAANLLPPKAAAASEPTTVKFNIDLPSIEPTGIQALEPKPHQPASFQVGEKIEILCQDSGMRGCWFVCKILKVSENSFKVQYNDIDDVEESGKLEEWVRSSRLADPGKLSLRHSGRPMIRPCPPEEPSRQFFEVGAAVEAWWNNGWWESFVLAGVSLSSNNDSYHVFLPGMQQ